MKIPKKNRNKIKAERAIMRELARTGILNKYEIMKRKNDFINYGNVSIKLIKKAYRPSSREIKPENCTEKEFFEKLESIKEKNEKLYNKYIGLLTERAHDRKTFETYHIYLPRGVKKKDKRKEHDIYLALRRGYKGKMPTNTNTEGDKDGSKKD
ncbi:MAG: hypothetical protein N3D73_01180 [Candidatus Diapherotrites archaeon]|nr:hypothetical protein [Candidatus Diapherotrites archaeon]